MQSPFTREDLDDYSINKAEYFVIWLPHEGHDGTKYPAEIWGAFDCLGSAKEAMDDLHSRAGPGLQDALRIVDCDGKTVLSQ